jgi:hypothetical protein
MDLNRTSGHHYGGLSRDSDFEFSPVAGFPSSCVSLVKTRDCE